MVGKDKKRYKTVEYKRHDSVLVRISYGGKKSNPKRRFVVEGDVLKKDKHSDDYKVLLIPPGQINASERK